MWRLVLILSVMLIASCGGQSDDHVPGEALDGSSDVNERSDSGAYPLSWASPRLVGEGPVFDAIVASDAVAVSDLDAVEDVDVWVDADVGAGGSNLAFVERGAALGLLDTQ